MAKIKEQDSGLCAGMLVPVKSFVQYIEIIPGSFMESKVNAHKGKVLLVALLGECKAGTENQFDLEAAMRAYGWQPITAVSDPAPTREGD